MRMIELGNRASLAIEALTELRIRRKHSRQDLDGDGAIEPRVARLIHLSHATGTHQGSRKDQDGFRRSETRKVARDYIVLRRHSSLVCPHSSTESFWNGGGNFPGPRLRDPSFWATRCDATLPGAIE